MKPISPWMAAASLLFASPAAAFPIVVNNGLAPPNPENVFDHAIGDDVYVRDEGCGDLWDYLEPCPARIAATTIAVIEGGELNRLFVRDASRLELDGGRVNTAIELRDDAHLAVRGGTLARFRQWLHDALNARDRATVWIESGSIGGNTVLEDEARLVLTGGAVAASDGLVRLSEAAGLTATGGEIPGNVSAFDAPFVHVGGRAHIHSIFASDEASFAMDDGVVTFLSLAGNATGSFGELAFSDSVSISGTVRLDIDGGLISSDSALQARESARIDVRALVLDDWNYVLARDDARITIAGGHYIRRSDFHDGDQPWLVLDRAEIEVIGTGFAVDGEAVDFGPLVAESGRLTGTLRSGEAIDKLFERRTPGTAVLRLTEGAPDVLSLSGAQSDMAPAQGADPTVAMLSDEALLEVGPGRRIDSVYARGASHVAVDRGRIAGALAVADDATVTCSGGRLTSRVEISGAAALSTDGCTLIAGLSAEGNASARLVDSTIRLDLQARDRAAIEIEGGLVNEVADDGERDTSPFLYRSTGSIELEGEARLTLRDTRSASWITARDDARVDISGLGISRGAPTIYARDRSVVDIRGDSVIGHIDASGTARVFLHDSWVSRIWVQEEALVDAQAHSVAWNVSVGDAGRLILRAHRFDGGFREVSAPGMVTAYDEDGLANEIEIRMSSRATRGVRLAPALPVPEPASLLGQATAVLCLGWLRRRSRRQSFS